MEENIKQNIVSEPPKQVCLGMQLFRLGKIFANMSFVATALVLLAMLSSIIVPMVHMVVVILSLLLLVVAGILILFTFGLIFLSSDNPIIKLLEFIKTIAELDSLSVAKFCVSLVPYFCYIGLGVSVLSIIFFSISKNKSEKGKYGGVIACIILMIIALVIYYLLGGNNLWQS